MKIGLLVVAFILLIFGCSRLVRRSRLDRERTSFIGRFKVNIANSDFATLYSDSIKYSKLILNIKEDGTFNFSENPHFIYAQSGTWVLGESDVSAFCNLTFNNRQLVNQVNTGIESLYIVNPSSKDGKRRIKLLSFDRIN